MANLNSNNGVSRQIPSQQRSMSVGSEQQLRDGLSNAFLFDFKPGQVVYRYDVKIAQQKWEYSKTSGDHAERSRAQKINHSILRLAYENSGHFGTGQGVRYVYDCASVMFTNVPIKGISLELPLEAIPEDLRQVLRGGPVHVEIQQCRTEAHEMALVNEADGPMLTFLELLSSQPYIDNGSHFMSGRGELFENAVFKDVGNGIVLHNGLKKSVQMVQNEENKTPTPAIYIDVKKCLFFRAQNLALSVEAMQQNWRGTLNAKFWEKWLELYKGLRVWIAYQPARTIVIGDVTQESCDEHTFPVDGRQMSLAGFMLEHKRVQLEHPEWPAVMPRSPNAIGVFPLEQLVVMGNQRVIQHKLNSHLSREQIHANVIDPKERLAAINREAMKIGPTKIRTSGFQFLYDFGVKIGKDNEVPLNYHENQAVMFGNRKVIEAEEGRFDQDRSCKFIRGGKLNQWMVGHPRGVERSIVTKFVRNLVQNARERDFNVPDPKFEYVEVEELGTKMGVFSESGHEFFMFIDKKDSPSHDSLKLHEQQHRLITQQVTAEVAGRAGQATLGNIVNKMNMKLFGLNHIPIFEDIAESKFMLGSGKVLVVGYDANHAQKATTEEINAMAKKGITGYRSSDPDVVGFCGNYVKEPHNFCGDYFFQPSKPDVCDPVHFKNKIVWMLHKLKESGRRPPNIIFIIRDGLDEGKAKHAEVEEVRMFREACQQVSASFKPQFVYCIADKRHNRRFFGVEQQDQRASPLITNPEPGSAVDTKLVRTDMLNMYMQSHKPLRGTAKIPEFIFRLNEPNATKEELEAFIAGLCRSWQIVKSATSLPVPVYQAHELAKRGRANYSEFKRISPERVPCLPDGQVDCTRLTELLSYNDSTLAETRTTA